MSASLPALNPSIRAEMARAGLTQMQLSQKLGMSQSALSRRLSSDAEWSVGELVALADILGVPAARLLAEAVTS